MKKQLSTPKIFKVLMPICAMAGLILFLFAGDDCTRRLVNGTVDESKVVEYVSSGKGFISHHLRITYHYVVNEVGYTGSTFFCSFPYDQVPQDGTAWLVADKLSESLIKGTPVGVWVDSKNPKKSCLSPDRTIAITNYSEYRGNCVLTSAVEVN